MMTNNKRYIEDKVRQHSEYQQRLTARSLYASERYNNNGAGESLGVGALLVIALMILL